jgi:hypothetical protein
MGRSSVLFGAGGVLLGVGVTDGVAVAVGTTVGVNVGVITGIGVAGWPPVTSTTGTGK